MFSFSYVCSAMFFAQVCAPLDWRNPTPEGLVFHSLVKFQGTYYAGSGDGTYFSSPDFQNWTRHEVGFSNWHKLAVIQNQLVMVGESSRIVISNDGLSWDMYQVTGPAVTFNDIIFGGGQYVAVGTGGHVATSPDSVNWTLHTTPTTFWLNDVGFYEGAYFACGGNGALMSSPDAMTWTMIPTGVTQTLNTICGDNNGTIVVAGYGGKVFVNEGMGWNAIPGLSTNLGILELVWDGTQYVGPTQTQGVVRSSNLTDWPGVPLAYNRNHEDITFDGVEYLVAGYGGQRYRSTDAINWEDGTSGWKGHIYSMATDGSRFLIGTNTGKVLNTTNSFDYEVQEIIAANWVFNGNHYADGTWMLGTNGGHLFTSEDGTTWMQHATNFGNAIQDIEKGVNWIMGGANGMVQTSSDGTIWTPANAFTANSVNAVAGYGTSYVVGTQVGELFWSDDGVNFVPGTSPTSSAIFDIAVIEGDVFVCGQGGSWRSSDGVMWDPTGLPNRIHDIVKDAYTYFAVSDQFWATSHNGWDWIQHPQEPDITTNELMVFGAEGLFMGGTYGSVIHAATLSSLTPNWPDAGSTMLEITEMVNCFHPYIVD